MTILLLQLTSDVFFILILVAVIGSRLMPETRLL